MNPEICFRSICILKYIKTKNLDRVFWKVFVSFFWVFTGFFSFLPHRCFSSHPKTPYLHFVHLKPIHGDPITPFTHTKQWNYAPETWTEEINNDIRKWGRKKDKNCSYKMQLKTSTSTKLGFRALTHNPSFSFWLRALHFEKMRESCNNV